MSVNEPNWDDIIPSDGPIARICDEIAGVDELDLFGPLLMIGWRWGVVTLEDLEIKK